MVAHAQAGVVAFKLYPAGATTNSDSGVTDIGKCLPTLRSMAEVRGPFRLHECVRCCMPPFATLLQRLLHGHCVSHVCTTHRPAPFVSRQLPEASCVHFH